MIGSSPERRGTDEVDARTEVGVEDDMLNGGGSGLKLRSAEQD